MRLLAHLLQRRWHQSANQCLADFQDTQPSRHCWRLFILLNSFYKMLNRTKIWLKSTSENIYRNLYCCLHGFAAFWKLKLWFNQMTMMMMTMPEMRNISCKLCFCSIHTFIWLMLWALLVITSKSCNFFYCCRSTRQKTNPWRNEDASWFLSSTTPRSLAW